MKTLRRILGDVFWLAVAVLIIGGGVLGFRQLGAIAPVVEPRPIERPVASVQTTPLVAWSEPLPVRGTGFITPFRTLSLAAEQAGRIVEMHPALDRLGSFEGGDILVRLDDSSARAALLQAQSNLSTTQVRLDLTRTQLTRTRALRDRGIVAQEALDQLVSQEQELSSTLQGLEAALEAAEVSLGHTTVKAPFDGRVSAKRAELGAVIAVGESIADIYTSDRLEVTVALREEAAALIPGLFEETGASAEVTARFANQPLSWPAEIVRVEGALDPVSRALDVTVRLSQQAGPANPAVIASGVPPALLNSFADVQIHGAKRQRLYVVPSTAVFENNTEIHLAVDGALVRHPALLVHVDRELSFIELASVPDGARLIVSPLDLAIDGMPVADLSGQIADSEANQE